MMMMMIIIIIIIIIIIMLIIDRECWIFIDLVSTSPGVVFVVLLSYPKNTRILSAEGPQTIPYSYFSSHDSLTISFDSTV